MKLACKVIEDLLPLYCDGACTEETRALIETHLQECDSCRAYFSKIQFFYGHLDAEICVKRRVSDSKASPPDHLLDHIMAVQDKRRRERVFVFQ